MDFALIFSGISCLVACMTFLYARYRDKDSSKENNIKMNLKLDQLCNNTSQILIKQERHGERIQELERQYAVMERDLKTAFNQIDELKGKVN